MGDIKPLAGAVVEKSEDYLGRMLNDTLFCLRSGNV